MPGATILVDENIPFGAEVFGTLGTVRRKHGREIRPADLADVDLLIVRSITRVNRALLAGTPVRFVATATSGSDHVAADELRDLGVTFYAALGCNANSVAEYMTAAWLHLARRTNRTLRGLRVGVVGVGHVGSLVAAKARALGMEPVLNDPPKARVGGGGDYRALNELAGCDIVTCHTPLTRDGDDPTWHLIGADFMARMPRGSWLCNGGRGGVVDEAALHAALDRDQFGACVLDVWDDEPAVDGRLLGRVSIASPHIAGYSLEGKLNGTSMVYEAACQFLGEPVRWRMEEAAPPPTVPCVEVDARGRVDDVVLDEVVSRVYPIADDDARMRATLAVPDVERGRAFDRLRKDYPVRREFRFTRVRTIGASPAARAALAGLQFVVDEQSS
jgi:erythronate-4-phosphate dehydrogenase